jgi:hypothetical protein
VQDVLAERIIPSVAGPSHRADGDLISGDLVAERSWPATAEVVITRVGLAAIC